MGVPEGVPEDRCGFTLEPEDLPTVDSEEVVDVDREDFWEQVSIASCYRHVWDGRGRCIWHADVEKKPVEELVADWGGESEQLNGAVLEGIRLDDSLSFEGCELVGARLSGSPLHKANLSDADLRRANLSDACLQGTDLSGADLRWADICGANLRWANISGAKLRGTDLSNADLRDVDLPDTDLRDAKLCSADLRWAEASGAKLGWANLSNAHLCGTNFSGTNLRRAVLSGTDLGGTDLSDAYLGEADLSAADLGGANLADAHLPGANLSDANLSDADLSGANLHKANLSNTNFHRVDVSSIDLRDADLSDSDIRWVDLSDFNLHRVDFSGAKFQGTDLSGTDLRDGDLSNTDLHNANLTGAYFHGADLSGTNLPSADLSGTDLCDANLSGANLRNANIGDSDLRSTTLSRSNFEELELDGIDLRGADSSEAKFHNAHFQDVRINDDTKFGDEDQQYRSAYELDADRTAASELGIDDTDDGDESDGEDDGMSTGFLPNALRRWRFWSRANRDSNREAIENLKKSIWSYRTYQRLLREQALPDKVPRYYVREKHACRKLALARDNYLEWLKLSLARWTMLYGESSWRVVSTSLVVIAIWTVLYLFTGGIEETVNSPNSITHDITLSFGPLVNSPPELATTIFANLYFSVVTFTTLGYGDVQPASGAVQFLAGVESLLGAALIALLVAVLSRRVMR